MRISTEVDRRISLKCTLALGLSPEWRCRTRIGKLFMRYKTTEVIAALALSEDPGAQKIVELYHSLKFPYRMAMESDQGLDHLIAATGGDYFKIAGIATENILRMASLESQTELAEGATDMAKAMKFYGSTAEGHQDRKTVLQSVGVAPVPKSSVTNMTITNSRLTSVNAQVNIPRLEDVTRAVEEAQQKLSGKKEPPVLEAENVP